VTTAVLSFRFEPWKVTSPPIWAAEYASAP
jgi:hypothetical protein